MNRSPLALLADADQMLAFAAMTVVPDGKSFRTANLNISFFRVARAHPIDIEAKVIAQSRQLIHVRPEFHDPAGQSLAEASAHQSIQTVE